VAFRRLGYHGATVEQIAAALGMKKGNLYYYFRSKEEILFACHEYSLDRILAQLNEMEESDLALRLHGKGARVLWTPWLRVFHDTDRSHHAAPAVTAASITNLALLAFLRYPIVCLPIGLGQIINRVVWLLGHSRSRGVATGIAGIPRLIWRHRANIASLV